MPSGRAGAYAQVFLAQTVARDQAKRQTEEGRRPAQKDEGGERGKDLRSRRAKCRAGGKTGGS
jgi:hypothetical protein